METPMLNIFANMMNVATRQDRWGAPDHWRDRRASDRRSRDELERDRARSMRALRDVGRL
jgi:hypothetical protein